MSDPQPSKVFFAADNDPEMQAACEKARATFRYFWRELAWERRRIIPGLNLACVKAPFSDGEHARAQRATSDTAPPNVEQMWLDEIDFDGQFVTGVLVNNPNWLKSVKQGDSARFGLSEISDWMYAGSLFEVGKRVDVPEVYGAFTVNLLRSRMGRHERKEHDDAWGLDFGDPIINRIVPYGKKKSAGLLQSWFGKREPEPDVLEMEHPMSEAMAPKLKEQLAQNPSLLHSKDDRGWTFLHQLALAGSAATVKVLLEAGADPNARTDQGITPLQLAKSLGWQKVTALLAGRGAK
jgi:uncharacterized protein YegJ (DUF2314 family)